MIFNNVSVEQKQAIMQSSIANIEYELYRELLMAGVDPETFSGIEDIQNSENPDMLMRLPRFTEILSRLAFVKEMLENS